MRVKVIEGRSSNYRVDDCDWLIAGIVNRIDGLETC